MSSVFKTLLMVLCLLAAPVMAAGPEDRVKAQLEAQGFTVQSVGRTWLGRTVIKAQSKKHVREVVINRVTGAVVQDYWEEREVAKGQSKSAGSTRDDYESTTGGKNGSDDSGQSGESGNDDGGNDDGGNDDGGNDDGGNDDGGNDDGGHDDGGNDGGEGDD